MDNKDLVNRARENGGYSSLASLAKAVGVNHSSLSLLASGKGELSDDTYVKLAKLAGVDPVRVLIEKHARKAGPEAAPMWKQMQKHWPKSAALLLVVILIVPNIQAHAASFQNINVIKCLLC
jgi:transcriptional regulator with XRE-family HTH domain